MLGGEEKGVEAKGEGGGGGDGGGEEEEEESRDVQLVGGFLSSSERLIV